MQSASKIRRSNPHHDAPELPLGTVAADRTASLLPLTNWPSARAARLPPLLPLTCLACAQLRANAQLHAAHAPHTARMSIFTGVTGHGGTVPLFINGEFVESKTDTFIDVVNPVRLTPPGLPCHLRCELSLGKASALLLTAAAA